MSRPVLRVLRAGLMTTVQDCGRPDCGHLGVPRGGAIDLLSHRLANRLVGNPDTAATLEMTLRGDDFEFLDDAVIAVCGADMRPELDDRNSSPCVFPVQRPMAVARGSILKFGPVTRGCRTVLAVAGGIAVPELLGSRSTLLRAGWGGFEGRKLAAGDILSAGKCGDVAIAPSKPRPGHVPNWSIRLQPLPGKDPVSLRFVSGTHWQQLTASAQQLLSLHSFEVRSESDRMGYRLCGPSLELTNPEQGRLPSAAVVPGTLQLPADGQLLLLMADCAPTGGYPRIGHVITADLPIAAQLCPGHQLRLIQITHADALKALQQQERDLRAALMMVSDRR